MFKFQKSAGKAQASESSLPAVPPPSPAPSSSSGNSWISRFGKLNLTDSNSQVPSQVPATPKSISLDPHSGMSLADFQERHELDQDMVQGLGKDCMAKDNQIKELEQMIEELKKEIDSKQIQSPDQGAEQRTAPDAPSLENLQRDNQELSTLLNLRTEAVQCMRARLIDREQQISHLNAECQHRGQVADGYRNSQVLRVVAPMRRYVYSLSDRTQALKEENDALNKKLGKVSEAGHFEKDEEIRKLATRSWQQSPEMNDNLTAVGEEFGDDQSEAPDSADEVETLKAQVVKMKELNHQLVSQNADSILEKSHAKSRIKELEAENADLKAQIAAHAVQDGSLSPAATPTATYQHPSVSVTEVDEYDCPVEVNEFVSEYRVPSAPAELSTSSEDDDDDDESVYSIDESDDSVEVAGAAEGSTSDSAELAEPGKKSENDLGSAVVGLSENDPGSSKDSENSQNDLDSTVKVFEPRDNSGLEMLFAEGGETGTSPPNDE